MTDTRQYYTLDRTDWGRLKEKWGMETVPSVEHYYRKEQTSPGTTIDWTYSAGLYLWMLWRVQQEGGGITLNNYDEVFPFISDISYVHGYTFFSGARARAVEETSQKIKHVMEDEALRETLGGGPWRGQRSSLLNGSGAGCAPVSRSPAPAS